MFRSDVKEALLEEFKKRERGPEKLSKAIVREFVQGLKLWQDLKPKRLQALYACVEEDETKLSFEPGAVITGVRPAAWLVDGWLEGALDGRVGLVFREDVEYL